ncbi:MAG: hypothetical protein AAGA56_11145 [Myxococcota bacterium]
MKATFIMAGTFVLVAAVMAGCGDDEADGTMTTTTMTGTGDSTDTSTSGDGGTDEIPPMPRGADNPPEPGTQIDRTGRPAISTALIEAFNPDMAAANGVKDAYNQAGPDTWAEFTDEIQGSLAVLDGLDEDCGNQLVADQTDGDRYGFLAGVLADDQLYVLTTSGTCGTYLGLEAEIVGALDPGMGGCGGRTPADDIIERSYSVLALGDLDGFDDGITADDGAQTATFPFLGPPL